MEETSLFNEKESLQTFDFTLDSDAKNVFKMLLSYGKMKIFFFYRKCQRNK